MLCVYRSVPETMLWHNNTINDDFHIFEKIDFLKFKSWLKKTKIEDFTKNSCPDPRIVLLEQISLQSPQSRLESTSPPLLPTCIPEFDFFENYSKTFQFLNISWYKTKFLLLLPQIIFIKKHGFWAFWRIFERNLISRTHYSKIPTFKVMFRNVW